MKCAFKIAIYFCARRNNSVVPLSSKGVRRRPRVHVCHKYDSYLYLHILYLSKLSPGQGLRTRVKRTTGKQGLRYTPEAP